MYKYQLTVQFEDIDSYGIIHHPRVLYFMERARVHFFIENGIDIKTEKYGLVLREINIKLKSQILMFDNLTIELTTLNIDKFRFTLNYDLKCNDKLMVQGQTEMVVIDLESKKLVQIPAHIEKTLSSILKTNV